MGFVGELILMCLAAILFFFAVFLNLPEEYSGEDKDDEGEEWCKQAFDKSKLTFPDAHVLKRTDQ